MICVLWNIKVIIYKFIRLGFNNTIQKGRSVVAHFIYIISIISSFVLIIS